MTLQIKICGLRETMALDAALESGADMVGFVFYPPSPRHVRPAQAAALAKRARGRAAIVALAVDASDGELADIVATLGPDLLQLHGAESPERVAAIRRRFGPPVMKAIRVADAADLAGVGAFVAVADRILFDAKPPASLSEALPGGNGLAFDWRLLAGLDLTTDFMLSGGLDAGNVATALAITGAQAVDVSSGVESAPGVKDPEKIRAFVRAARQAAETTRRDAGEKAATERTFP